MALEKNPKIILKRCWDHFFIKAWPVWILPLGIVLALFIPYPLLSNSKLWISDLHYLLSGFTLQFFFVCILIRDLIFLRKELGQIDYLILIKNWFSKIPKIFKKRHYTFSPDTIKSNIKAGPLKVSTSINSDADLSERVDHLEKKINNLENEVRNKNHQLKSEIRELESEIKKEKKSRTEDISEVHDLIKQISTIGLELEFIGLIWLTVGLIMSIFPTQIACFVIQFN